MCARASPNYPTRWCGVGRGESFSVVMISHSRVNGHGMGDVSYANDTPRIPGCKVYAQLYTRWAEWISL